MIRGKVQGIILVFIPGDADEIYFGINQRTDLGSLVDSYNVKILMLVDG